MNYLESILYFANEKTDEDKKISIFTINDVKGSQISLNKLVFKEGHFKSSKGRTLKKDTHL